MTTWHFHNVVLFTLNSGRVPKPFTFKFPNLVPRAQVPFGQHQDTELWNNQFPETKILDFRLHGACLAWFIWRLEIKSMWIRSTKAFNTHWKKLGKSKFGFESTTVSNFKSKRHEGPGNELVDYSRASPKGTWALGTRLQIPRTDHGREPKIMFRQFNRLVDCVRWTGWSWTEIRKL